MTIANQKHPNLQIQWSEHLPLGEEEDEEPKCEVDRDVLEDVIGTAEDMWSGFLSVRDKGNMK